jgi:4-hydroxy-2-oxoheptanedioate aldolase
MSSRSAERPELWLFASVPHHALVEMGAYLGVDGMIFDDEKIHVGPDALQAMFLAAEKHNLATKVRLRESTPARIEYILSLGATAILLPRLEGAVDVEAAIASTRFPSTGTRGLGHSRATAYGLRQSWQQILDGSADPPQVEVIVETRELLDEIDEVAALDAVHGLDIGLMDLSAALGHPGATATAEVQAAIDTVIEAAQRAGKPVGMSVGTPAAAVEMRGRGLTSLVLDAATLLKFGLNEFRGALDAFPAGN